MSTNVTEVLVTGMTCGHCVASVTEELESLAGVDSVAIDLNKGGDSKVAISSTEPISDDAIRAAVAEAGYEVVTR